MVELFLLAQLSGPRCGWNYGAEITPFTSPVGGIGCVVPNAADPNGTRLLPDPFTPGGIRAEPAGPSPIPTYQP